MNSLAVLEINKSGSLYEFRINRSNIKQTAKQIVITVCVKVEKSHGFSHFYTPQKKVFKILQ